MLTSALEEAATAADVHLAREAVSLVDDSTSIAAAGLNAGRHGCDDRVAFSVEVNVRRAFRELRGVQWHDVRLSHDGGSDEGKDGRQLHLD